MISNNLQGNISLGISTVLNAGHLGGILNNREQEVSLKVVLYPLHNGSNTLQAHAGIDVLVLQIVVGAFLGPVELGEHVIPDFQIAVTVTAYAAGRAAAATLLPQVNENLRIRSARAGADFPEVVLQLHDMSRIKARLCLPQLLCLGILRINGCPQLVFWQLQYLGQELPGPRNSFLLEIITKGEVAQHLKISLMTGSTAYILNIAGTHAALAGGNTSARRLYLAGEIRLERRHACTHHQESRIILRNQGGTWQPQMTFLLSKKLEISLPQFIT